MNTSERAFPCTYPWRRTLALQFSLIACMLGALLPAPRLHAQPGGAVDGRVLSNVTGAFLGNARISVAGTAIETTTDDNGAYHLPDVSAGDVTLRASYLGLETKVQVVRVEAGKTAHHDFTLDRYAAGTESGKDITTLQAVTVIADREMSAQAVALNEQRHAANIKSVVAFDEYPTTGTGNIGEFLKYMPGVAISFSGNSATDVSVRGMPGYTTGVTLDGGPVASTTGGETRNVQLWGIPINNVSLIEVTKVPTPDLPASALGGAVNIVSKSGFERTRPLFTYNLYSTFNADYGLTLAKRTGPIDRLTSRHINPSLDFSYILPINKSLAITFGASHIDTYPAADQTAPVWNLLTLVQTSSIWQTTPQVVSTRTLSAGVDWKLGAHHVFGASIQRRARDAEAATSSYSVVYGTGAVGGPTFTQGATTGVGSLTQTFAWLQLNSTTTQLTFKHRYTDGAWRIDTNASYSHAEAFRFTPDYFANVATAISNLVIRGDGINGSGKDKDSIIPSTYTVSDRTGRSVDMFDGSRFVMTTATTNDFRWDRKNWQAKSDVRRNFGTTIPWALKIGAVVTQESYDSVNRSETFTIRPGTADDVRLAGNYGAVDPEYSQQVASFAGKKILWVSPRKVYDLYRANPGYFVRNDTTFHTTVVNGSKELTETVSAGYIRGDLKLLQNRLWLVGGVRYEHTSDKGAGPLNDPSALLVKDARGNLVRNAAGQTIFLTNDTLERTRLQYKERGARTDREYDDLYPSFNTSYSITDTVVARVGYARTIGRPNTSFILPGVTYSAVTAVPQTITVTNTGLKPWTGDNYDVSLESYAVKGGFGSVGFFQKNIRDFFTSVVTPGTPEQLALYGVTPDSRDTTYQIATMANGGSADIRGFEFAYKQSLTFLPPWARGLQVFVNVTKLWLHGSSTSDFTGFNPRTLSYGVNLTRPRFVVKFLMQVQDETRRSPVAASAASGIPAGTYLWQGGKTRPSVSGEFRLRRGLSLYGSLSDFASGGFQDVQRRYAAGDTPAYARYQRLQEWGVAAMLGIKGEF